MHQSEKIQEVVVQNFVRKQLWRRVFKRHMMCVFGSIEVGLQGCLLSSMVSHMTEESWCFVALFYPVPFSENLMQIYFISYTYSA